MSTPNENLKRVKRKLSSLRRTKRFVDWRNVPAFARELEALLQDVEGANPEPKTGVELVAAFFKCDEAVINRCDDSNGTVGGVFRWDARELLVKYAADCTDKAWLEDLVVDLCRENDYGLRDTILPEASRFLDEASLRRLVDRFWALAEAVDQNAEHADYQRMGYFHLVESLASQLRDAPLFERARVAAWPNMSVAAHLDIARVYFEAGDSETALSWLNRVHESETFKPKEREDLLCEIHEQRGEQDELREVASRAFNRERSVSNLDRLLKAIGEDQRDAVLDEQTRLILNSGGLSPSDAQFLVEVDRIDAAAEYLLKYAGELNGDHYWCILPLAEAMESHGLLLAASMAYRALLDSILRRANSKYYNHGVRYLRKLDRLTTQVSDWAGFPCHAEYKSAIADTHKRKRVFWERYGGLPGPHVAARRDGRGNR